MSNYVLCPTRHGGLAARIGLLVLRWDRNGRLSLGDDSEHTIEIGAAGVAPTIDVEDDAARWMIRQGHDGNARFVVIEEGPQRIGVRLHHRLYDEQGIYHGDGLQEVWAYANGDIYVAAAISFADQAAHACITDAWLAITRGNDALPLLDGPSAWSPDAEASLKDMQALILPGGERSLLVAWQDALGMSYHPSSPATPWTRREDTPPYYERWGDLYDQWPGDAGWDAAQGATLVHEAGEVRWYWRRGMQIRATPLEGHRAVLHLRQGSDGQALLRWAKAQREPLEPDTRGLTYRYWSTLDGAYRLRHDGAQRAVVRFPADPLARNVHLCIHDLPAAAALAVAVDGQPVAPQTVSLGGRVEDPLGAVSGRVDAGHGPLLTDPDTGPDELVLSAALHPDRETEIALEAAPGVQLSYQRWDARRQLLLTSSLAPGRCLGQLSLWDGVLRRLTKPGAASWGIAQLPLAWFRANALTPFHYVNNMEGLELLENGPDVVRLRYQATNANRRAQSDQDVRIRVLPDALLLDIRARFTVLERWDPGAIQYLNLFPAASIDPQHWLQQQVLLMDSEAELACFDVHRPPEPPMDGNPGWSPVGDLFMGQFASDRGNILVLATELAPDSLRQSYQFCIHWLDSHFIVEPATGAAAPDDVWSVRLQIALAGDAQWDAAHVREIGRRSLAAGTLVL